MLVLVLHLDQTQYNSQHVILIKNKMERDKKPTSWGVKSKNNSLDNQSEAGFKRCTQNAWKLSLHAFHCRCFLINRGSLHKTPYAINATTQSWLRGRYPLKTTQWQDLARGSYMKMPFRESRFTSPGMFSCFFLSFFLAFELLRLGTNVVPIQGWLHLCF